MLILVAVTLNIALDDNGIIAKTKEARAKQEKASIYDKIVAALVYDREGVDLQASYQNIEETLYGQGYTVTMAPNDSNNITENGFTVTVEGKYAEEETYRIAKNGISYESGAIQPEQPEPYSFTLNDLNLAMGGTLAQHYYVTEDKTGRWRIYECSSRYILERCRNR